MWARRSMKCDGSRAEKRVESKQKKQTKKQKHDVEKNEGRYEVAGAALRIVGACRVITVSQSPSLQ